MDNDDGLDGLVQISNPGAASLDDRRLNVSRQLSIPMEAVPADPTNLELFAKRQAAAQQLSPGARQYMGEKPELTNVIAGNAKAVSEVDYALGAWNAANRGPLDSFVQGFHGSERGFKEADLALSRRAGSSTAKAAQDELFKMDAQQGPDSGFWATMGSMLSQITHYGTAGGAGGIAGGLGGTAAGGPVGAVAGAATGALVGVRTQMAWDALGQSQADADRLESQYGVEIGAGTRALWGVVNVAGTLAIDKALHGTGLARNFSAQAADNLLIPLANKESTGTMIKEAGKALLREEASSATQMAAFAAVNQYTAQFAREANNLPSIFNDPDQRASFYEGLFHAAAVGALLGSWGGYGAMRDSFSLSLLKNKAIERQAAWEQLEAKAKALPEGLRDQYADDNFNTTIQIPVYRINELYQGRDLRDPLGPLSVIPDLPNRVKEAPGGMLEVKPSEYLHIPENVIPELKDHVRLGGDYPSVFHTQLLEEVSKAAPDVAELGKMFKEMLDGQENKETPEAKILQQALDETLPREDKVRVATDAIHADMPEVADYLLGRERAKANQLSETDVRTIKPEDIGDAVNEKGKPLTAEQWLRKQAGEADTTARALAQLTSFQVDKDGKLTVNGKAAKDSGLTALEAKILLGAKAKATRLFTSRFIENPATLGMTKAQYKAWAVQVLKANNALADAAEAAAKKIEARRLTKEWKEERETTRTMAELAVDNDQGMRAYSVLSQKDGPKLSLQRVIDTYKIPFNLADGTKIFAHDLLRDVVDEHGFEPGILATHMEIRYKSGKEMMDRLLLDEILRRDHEESRNAYRERLVQQRMDKIMEDRHGGSLDAAIADAVDQAARSAPSLVILDHELRALGNKVGMGEMATKEKLMEGARAEFGNLKLRDADRVKDFEKGADLAARRVEMALLKGDDYAAWIAKQEQYKYIMQIELAREARKSLEKFGKAVDSLTSEQMPAGYNFHLATGAQLMLRALGFETRRSETDAMIMLDGLTPGQLYNRAISEHNLGPSAFSPEAEELFKQYGRTGKPVMIDSLPWSTAKEVMDSTQAMIKLARKVGEIEREAKAEALKGTAEAGKLQGEKDRETFAPKLIRSMDGWLKMMPAIALRFDQGNKLGWFHTNILRPMQEAASRHVGMNNELAAHIKANWPKALKAKELSEEFYNYALGDPENPGQYMAMTREKLRGMMLHIGSESNLAHLIDGANQRIDNPAMRWTPEKVEAYVQRWAKPEDYAWMQAVFDTYDKYWGDYRDMQHRTMGWAPDKVEPRQIADAEGNKYKGGYSPIFYAEGVLSPTSADAFFGDTWQSPYPSRRAMHERGFAAGPLDLSDNTMLGLSTVLRDIAYREPVSKVLALTRSDDFSGAMTKHWGEEFGKPFFEQWLKDTVGITDKVMTEGKAVYDMINRVRRNYMAAQLVFSASTIVKHGLSAGMNSMAEIMLRPGGWKEIPAFTQNMLGQYIDRLARHINSPAGQALDREFVYNSSEYMRNRSHVGMDAFTGTMLDQINGTEIPSGIARKIAEFGGKAYNFIDQASAIPLWMVEYERVLGEGKSHADAVYSADQAVIMGHGDTQSVNAAALIRSSRRGGGPGPTFAKEISFIYGFFNHMYNRDSDWLISRTIDNALGHDHYGLGPMTTVQKQVLYALFYGWATGLVKHIGGEVHDDEDKSFAKEVGGVLLHRFGGDIPIARNIISSLSEGFDNQAPIFSVGEKIFSAGKQLYKAWDEGDTSEIKMKTQINAVGQALGIPGSGQFAKTATTVYNRQQGNTDAEPYDLIRDLFLGDFGRK